jgi:hypothetical protein
MKMAQEADVLKSENDEVVGIFEEMRAFVTQQASKGTPVHEVEIGLWRQLLTLGNKLFGEFLALQGTGDVGETVTLPTGQTCQRLEKPHPRRYVSIFGIFTLQRTVYGSREGQRIDFVPLDNRLQLPAGAFSNVLQDWDQGLCVEQAFSQAARTIERILGLKQSVDSLEHMNGQMAKPVEAFREERSLPPPAEEGAVFVSSADGKGVVMRRQPEETAPKGHRSKGDKASRKEMAIVGAVYSVDRHVRTAEEVVAALFGDDPDQPKPQRPQPCHKQTMASLTKTNAAGTSGMELTYLWLSEELHRRNRGGVKEMVHICDGQEALWETRRQNLPTRNTTDILDLLHVTPRLWQAAHLFHKEGSAEAKDFVRVRLLKILQGRSEGVVRGLREMATKRRLTGTKKTTLRKVCAYLENNRDRLHYDEYLAKGYPIASGVIEGACRHLVKDRMERAGMHWTRSGAQAMLDLRSVYINGDWDTYQTYRIDYEVTRLYPYHKLVEELNYSLAT